MCLFFSCIVAEKNLEIYHNPYTDSHDALITYFGFKDDKIQNKWVRVEFVPQDNKYTEVDSYILKCEDSKTPDWFTKNQEKIRTKLQKIIKAMIITDERKILLGGCYILSGNAKITLVNQCRIARMEGNSTIKTMWAGTIEIMWAGTIENMRAGTIENMRAGTIKDMRAGTIENMWAGTVEDMWAGTIKTMWAGTIEIMRAGTIKNMWAGTIEDMRAGTIKNMWNNARIIKDSRKK